MKNMQVYHELQEWINNHWVVLHGTNIDVSVLWDHMDKTKNQRLVSYTKWEATE